MTAPDPEDEGRVSADAYFTMLPDWILEHPAISDRSVRVWLTLMSYARNRNDRSAFPGRKVLAQRCHCSTDSIDRSFRELVKAGALRVEPRWRADGSRSSNNYVVHTVPQEVAATVRPPRSTGAAARVRAREPEPSTSRSRRTKRAADKNPEPLSPDWTPNHTHRALARKLWLDLDMLVDEFRGTQAAEERRSDWDKTFSAFINDYDAGPGHHWATG